MKLQLIPEAGQWHRMWTIRLAALVVAFASLPQDMQKALLSLLPIEPGRLPGIVAALFVIAKLTKQKSIVRPDGKFDADDFDDLPPLGEEDTK